MIALLMAPIYILINIYLIRWILRWMGACYYHFKNKFFIIGFAVVYTLIATTLLTGFLIKEPVWLHRILKQIGNYWLGTFLYLLLAILMADLIRFIIKKLKLLRKEVFAARKTFVIAGTVVAITVCLFTVHGILHQKRLYTTKYEVSIDKQVEGIDSLKVVLVGDLHLGYSIGDWKMKQMVERINKQDADIVCIAGDIFDNDYTAVKNPEKIIETLKGLKSTYGIYACWGNHDLNEPILAGFTFDSGDDKVELKDPRMKEFIESCGITLLTDESVLIDNKFYIVGRDDPQLSKKTDYTRLTPDELTDGLDKTKPIIVVEHQPKELQELADAGADLDINGHTHDGQMFPGNLTVKLMWENACGYLQKDNMHNIVTSGVGIWGPNMRVGTRSEICVINVDFQ